MGNAIRVYVVQQIKQVELRNHMIKSRIKKVCVMPLASPSISIEQLERCLNSIELQQYTPFDFEVVVVVNSIDAEYGQLVEKTFGKDYTVVITESNGKSGKGHNARLDVYRKLYKEKGYTHVMPIDGDDYYYPIAFFCVDELDKKSRFDYLSGMAPFVDSVRKYPVPDRDVIMVKTGVYLWSFGEKRHLSAIAPIGYWNGVQCPGGEPVLCMSNKAVKCNLRYLDDVGLGDDYPHLCQAVLAHLAGKLTWVGTDCNEIYVYDQMEDAASSSRGPQDIDEKKGWPFDSAGLLEQEIKHKKYRKLQGITRQHLPYATLPQHMSKPNKVNFIIENLLEAHRGLPEFSPTTLKSFHLPEIAPSSSEMFEQDDKGDGARMKPPGVL